MNKIQKVINYLLYIFLFILPWQTAWIWQENFINGKKWEYGTFVIYGTEILLWVIAMLQLFLWVKGRKFQISNFKFQKRKFLIIISIWLFVLWSGLTIFWSGNKELGFYYWFRLLEGVALFFILINLKLDLRKIAWLITLSGVVQAGLSFWQFFTQRVVASKWLGLAEHLASVDGTLVIEHQSFRWLRAYGSFAHPNVLGGFLVICFCVGLFLYFHYRPGWLRIFCAVALIIIAGGIFCSFSRSAWLTSVVVYCLWFIITFWQNKKRLALFKITSYLALLAVLLFFIYQPLVMTRIRSGERLEIQSNQERADYLVQAQTVITQHWFKGVGLGNYTNHLYQKDSTLWIFEYQPVHNIYLLIFAELGLIGIMIFVFLLFYTLVLIIKSQNNLVLKLGLFFVIFIIGFFDHYLWTSYLGIIILWLVWGLIIKEKYL